jgi:hypothetical protein
MTKSARGVDERRREPKERSKRRVALDGGASSGFKRLESLNSAKLAYLPSFALIVASSAAPHDS